MVELLFMFADKCLFVNRSQIKFVHHIKRSCFFQKTWITALNMDLFYDLFMSIFKCQSFQ